MISIVSSVGAYIVSPFVGRLDDINQVGVDLIRDVVSAYRQQSIATKVLSASLRNPIHVQDSALAGADIATPAANASGIRPSDSSAARCSAACGPATIAADFRNLFLGQAASTIGVRPREIRNSAGIAAKSTSA